MTAGEQSTLNAALLAANRDQVVVTRVQGGTNVYQLCETRPVQQIADIVAFANLFSVTVSP